MRTARKYKMRDFVTLKTITTNERSDGTVGTTATTLAESVPASVSDVRAVGRFRGRKISASTTHVVDTRYRSDLKARDQVVFGSDTLHIVGIKTDGRKRIMTIDCNSDAD